MEPDGSLPYSLDPATDPHSEPDEFCPHIPTISSSVFLPFTPIFRVGSYSTLISEWRRRHGNRTISRSTAYKHKRGANHLGRWIASTKRRHTLVLPTETWAVPGGRGPKWKELHVQGKRVCHNPVPQCHEQSVSPCKELGHRRGHQDCSGHWDRGYHRRLDHSVGSTGGEQCHIGNRFLLCSVIHNRQ
jgi:hypothetical protein